VPKLKHKTFAAAKRKLKNSGCVTKLHRTGKLRRHGKRTHVKSQKPKAGKPLLEGAHLTVKLG
jgi:beta-lactam-binding protein with PASTA domain